MKDYIKFISAMLIFGSIGIFVQAVPLRSSALVGARTVIGSLLLSGILLVRHKKPDWGNLKKHLVMLVAAGIVMGLNWLFLFGAYQYTTVSIATLIYYLAPVMVLFLSPVFLKERLTGSRVAGIMTALLGMLLVNGASMGGEGWQKGLILGLLSAVFYAALMILNKRIEGVPLIEKTLVQLLTAAVVMVAYTAWTHKGGLVFLEGKDIITLLIIGIVHTGIAYYLYVSSMQEIPGQTVALCSYIDPASALIFSAVFLQERLSILQITGAFLILSGSAFGSIYQKNIKYNERSLEKEG